MRTRSEVRWDDGESVWLRREPLPEAHGAVGLRLPEGEGERVVFERVASSDVEHGITRVWSRRGCPDDDRLERWARAALFDAWATGEVVLAPTIAPVVFQRAPMDPGEWEVAPDLRMLPVRTATLPPATHTNTFLVGARERVLVEPAPTDASERERLLRFATRGEGRLVAIALTHHHPDHVGAADLARELGVPLIAHEANAARLRVAIDEPLEEGDTIPAGELTLHARHTPGHAPGHLCFFEERSGGSMVGDMVAGVGTILVAPGDGDMQAYLDSLERLAVTPARFALPAHGGVLREPATLYRRYVTHRLTREAKVLRALVARGASTAQDLLHTAYDDAPQAAWPLAHLSTLAHLDKLAREGRVRRDGDVWRA